MTNLRHFYCWVNISIVCRALEKALTLQKGVYSRVMPHYICHQYIHTVIFDNILLFYIAERDWNCSDDESKHN